jgi:hypothetical protein
VRQRFLTGPEQGNLLSDRYCARDRQTVLDALTNVDSAPSMYLEAAIARLHEVALPQ